MSKFLILAGVSCLVLTLSFSEAYAWGRGWGRGRDYHYYRGNRWYNHSWFWFDTAVSALAIGALVVNLPPRYTTVVYSGVPYYYADGYYYKAYPTGGYIVVPPPVVVAAPIEQPAVTQASDLVTVNIPNAKGGYTPVVLKKAGSGYVGPQGEYYSDHPTVEQLKILYGGK